MNQSMRKSIFAVLGILLLALIALGIWSSRRSIDSGPPLPRTMSRIEPAVVQLIRKTRGDLSKDLTDPGRWLELGKVYDANEFYELAAECYQRAASLNEADAQSWYHLGVARRRLGQDDEAIEAMHRAAELAHSYAPAHWRLGIMLLEQGRLQEAGDAFRRATQIDDQDSAGWLGLARVDLTRGDNQSAAATLETLLTWTTTNVGYANQLLGVAYRRLGRTQEAQTAMMRSQGAPAVWNDRWRLELMNFRPGYTPRLRQANALIAAGKVDEGMARLEQLHEEYPEKHTVAINLANAYRIKGRLQESVRLLGEVVAVKPEDYRAHFSLAASCGKISQLPGIESPEVWRGRALEHAQHAIDQNPSLSAAYALIGDLLVLEERFGEAVDQYREAYRRDPASYQWLYRAGVVHMQQQQWAEAAQDLETVTRQAPTFVGAFRALSLAQVQLGRLEEAETTMLHVKQLSPDDPTVADELTRIRALRDTEAPLPAVREDGEAD